jgi:hypothetical protein
MTLLTDAGAEITVTIRALKVREYPAAFAAFAGDEEWKLLLLCSVEGCPPLTPDWPLTLTPEAYERAVAAMEQENPAFFAWCVRRTRNRMLRDGAAVARLAAEAGQMNASGAYRGGSMSPNSPQRAG